MRPARPPSLRPPSSWPAHQFRQCGWEPHATVLCPLIVGTHSRVSEAPKPSSCDLKDEPPPLPLLLGVEWHATHSTSTALIEEISRKILFSPFFQRFCIFIVNEGFKSHLTSVCPPAFPFSREQLLWNAASFVILLHMSLVTSASPGRAAAGLRPGDTV